jgi:hypothetical protein
MISEAQAAEAPRIVIPTRPLEVPPELLALQPDAVVCYSQAKNPGAYLQSAFGTAAEAIRLVRDTIARQAAGRFYIFEVAQILADENGLSARDVLREMLRAVECERLSFRRFCTGLPVGHGDPRGEYMTPADLNSWLEGQGAGYRFPTPQAAEASTHAPSTSASASPAAHPEAVPVAPKGVQKREMVKRHAARWPTIETDMKDAGKNGLAAAAKAGERGWREAAALEWAREKSRLLSVPEPGTLDAVMGGGFPSRRHTLAH